MEALNALIVEDSPDDLALVLMSLKQENFSVRHVQVMTPADLSYQLGEKSWDVIISDYEMPSFSGLEALKIVREKSGDIPFILVSGKITDEIAVNVIKAGANDYVLKDNLVRLGSAVRREIAELKERRKLESELRVKEEMIRQTQKLEALGALAGGIVHDFNNFLALVMIGTELAEESLDASHPARENINEIRVAAQRAAGLTRQLLTFCRKSVVEPRDVDVNETVRECGKLFSRLLAEDIELDFDLSDEPLSIQIDPSQLEQVLMNFVVNARDAMPGGGKVCIRTFAESNHVGLSVVDSGVGIDESVRKKIFEPFFTTKGLERGTGLGLSTVMSIVDDYRGKLSVESELGQGSTFSVLFPASRNPSRSRAAIDRVDDLTGTETVLLMENDRCVRDMIVEVLKRNGYNVIVAKSPDHAVDLAGSHPGEIHLLLSDVMLPQTDGFEFGYLFSQIRQNTPILFVTGCYDRERFESKDQDLFRHILQKPFSGMALLEKLRSTLVN